VKVADPVVAVGLTVSTTVGLIVDVALNWGPGEGRPFTPETTLEAGTAIGVPIDVAEGVEAETAMVIPTVLQRL
jgi:hypothetical protein